MKKTSATRTISKNELEEARGGYIVIEDNIILREESTSDESFIIIDDIHGF